MAGGQQAHLDLSYVPPEEADISTAGPTHLLLRSQCHKKGCTEGQGLQFHSRISPSPSRSQRRRKSTATPEPQDQPWEAAPFSSRSLGRVHSPLVAGEAVVRQRIAIQRTTVTATTSTKSIKMEGVAGGGSTPRGSESGRPKPSPAKSSPRLRAWDATDWVTSPRTGYTYVNSPTYRETWTPDRDDVPMPHMARLPIDRHAVRRNLSADIEGSETQEAWTALEPIVTRSEAPRALRSSKEPPFGQSVQSGISWLSWLFLTIVRSVVTSTSRFLFSKPSLSEKSGTEPNQLEEDSEFEDEEDEVHVTRVRRIILHITHTLFPPPLRRSERLRAKRRRQMKAEHYLPQTDHITWKLILIFVCVFLLPLGALCLLRSLALLPDLVASGVDTYIRDPAISVLAWMSAFSLPSLKEFSPNSVLDYLLWPLYMLSKIATGLIPRQFTAWPMDALSIIANLPNQALTVFTWPFYALAETIVLCWTNLWAIAGTALDWVITSWEQSIYKLSCAQDWVISSASGAFAGCSWFASAVFPDRLSLWSWAEALATNTWTIALWPMEQLYDIGMLVVNTIITALFSTGSFFAGLPSQLVNIIPSHHYFTAAITWPFSVLSTAADYGINAFTATTSAILQRVTGIPNTILSGLNSFLSSLLYPLESVGGFLASWDIVSTILLPLHALSALLTWPLALLTEALSTCANSMNWLIGSLFDWLDWTWRSVSSLPSVLLSAIWWPVELLSASLEPAYSAMINSVDSVGTVIVWPLQELYNLVTLASNALLYPTSVIGHVWSAAIEHIALLAATLNAWATYALEWPLTVLPALVESLENAIIWPWTMLGEFAGVLWHHTSQFGTALWEIVTAPLSAVPVALEALGDFLSQVLIIPERIFDSAVSATLYIVAAIQSTVGVLAAAPAYVFSTADRPRNIPQVNPTVPTRRESAMSAQSFVDQIRNDESFAAMIKKVAQEEARDLERKLTSDLEELQSALEKAKSNSVHAEEIAQMKTQLDRLELELRSEISATFSSFKEVLSKEHAQMVSTFQSRIDQVSSEASAKRNESDGLLHSLTDRLDRLETERREFELKLKSCCKSHDDLIKLVHDELSTFWQPDSPINGLWKEYMDQHFVSLAESDVDIGKVSSDLKASLSAEFMELARNISRSETLQAVESVLKEEFTRRRANASDLDRSEVQGLIEAALARYDADKTGLFDYALESSGGAVISTRCTETFVHKIPMYSLFGIPLWYPSNNPRTAIQPGALPGECWAFKGSRGYLLIQLSTPMRPTQFSLEHISKAMSPSGKIDSAPKDFEVYGLRHEKDPEPFLFGTYHYDAELDQPLQMFPVSDVPETGESFPMIELDILSNHGNLNYTCLYRFRVHGHA